MAKLLIGLTGGIGSGKSTIATLFENLGVTCIDSDIIARDVVAPGTLALQHIVDKYSDAVLLHNGQLNRAYLREIIFNQPEERIWLNALLHPLIQAQMLQQANSATSAYVILMIPLLIESHWQHLVDRTASSRYFTSGTENESCKQRQCFRRKHCKNYKNASFSR